MKDDKMTEEDDLRYRAYQSYEYRHHSLKFPNRSREIEFFPEMLKFFLQNLAEKDDFYINELYGKRISDDTELVDFFYDELSNEERSHFLAFYTVDVHEVTHHVDLMTTPFGVYFHQKACTEFIAFQRFLPELWNDPRIGIRSKRKNLLDFEDILVEHPLNFRLARQWNILKSNINFFDAYFHYGRKVQPLWDDPNENSEFQLLGQEFEKLLINDFVTTIKIPGIEFSYLRPISILETRGLVHSMQWILYQLGYDNRSLSEVVNYLNTFYSLDGLYPDYRFLLSALFRGLGNIESFNDLKNVNGIGLDRFLSVISQLCWYALHAPPSTSKSGMYVSSPIIRLLLAINSFSKHYGRECLEILQGRNISSNTGVDLSAFFDELDNAKGILSIKSILNLSLDALEYISKINVDFVKNMQIKDHFKRIFDTQSYQLKKRLEDMKGYSSPLGMPQYGHPFYGIRGEIDAEQLMPDNYVPPDEVEKWFQYREHFIFQKLWTDQWYKSKFQRIFHPLPQDDDSSIRRFEDVNLTTTFYYLIEENMGNISFVFHDDILPKIHLTDESAVEHEARDYVLPYYHVALHVELLSEEKREFRRINIVICPLRIREDSTYKSKIERLILQTYDPISKSFNKRHAEISIINSSLAELIKNKNLAPEELEAQIGKSRGFVCVLSSPLVALTQWYLEFVLPSLDNLPSDIVDKTLSCHFCKERMQRITNT